MINDRWNYREINPGDRLGKWTILEECRHPTKKGLYLRLRCDCGIEKLMCKGAYTNGSSSSCIECYRNDRKIKKEEVLFPRDDDRDPLEEYRELLREIERK